jgi:hypothetical protein
MYSGVRILGNIDVVEGRVWRPDQPRQQPNLRSRFLPIDSEVSGG